MRFSRPEKAKVACFWFCGAFCAFVSFALCVCVCVCDNAVPTMRACRVCGVFCKEFSFADRVCVCVCV